MLGPGFDRGGGGHYGGMCHISCDDHICWFSSVPRMAVSAGRPDFSSQRDCRERFSQKRSGTRLWVVWGDRNVSSLSPGAHPSPSSRVLVLTPLTTPRFLLCLASYPEFLPKGFLHDRCLVSSSGLCFQITFQHFQSAVMARVMILAQVLVPGDGRSSDSQWVGCSEKGLGGGPTFQLFFH